MIWRECEVCGKKALLKEAGADANTGKYYETFECQEGHETKHRRKRRRRKPEDEIDALKRFNDFLNDLGVE